MTANPSLFKTVVTGSMVVGVGNIGLRLTGLLSTVLILNALSVYEYGLWRLVLSVLMACTIISLPGFDSTIVTDLGREAGRGNLSRYRSILTSFATLLLTLGLVAALMLAVSAPLITTITGIDLTDMLRILSVSLVFSAAARVMNFIFSTHLRFAYSQGMNATNALVYLFALLFFVLTDGLDVAGMAIAYLVASAASVIVFLPQTIKLIRPLRAVEAGEYSIISMMKGHGKWGVAGGYFDTFSNSIKPWIIGLFLGIEAVGIFAAAQAILSAINNFIPFNQVLASILPRESHDKSRLIFLLKKSLKYSYWLYALVAVASLISAPLLIPVLFPQYASSVPLFLILLASFLTLPMGSIQSHILNIYRSQKWIVYGNISARVFSVLIMLPVSLMSFGIFGAAIDHVVTSYLITYLRMRAVRRILPDATLPFSEVFTMDDYDRTVFPRLVRGIAKRI